MITLNPGTGVKFDASNGAEWQQKTRTFREIRGNILSACFSVEFLLDRLISEVFFPACETPADLNDEMEQPRNLFDDLILKGGRLSFASKIHLMKSLMVNARVGKAIDAELINKLDRLRDIRNRFAHYPVSFFPEKADERQVLVAKLVCRDRDLRLDETFFAKLDADFESVQNDFQKALKTLSGEPANPDRS